MGNQLANERSPYLRQHQHNPVHWLPWGVAALERAKSENKLIIVSIGYSACHWCHVMERESFEDEQVAALMNQHFISVKVDREERPDVDQLYMLAVQLMTQSGGWPLNCICLPDSRPIYGGTYFRKADWMQVLTQVQELWDTRPQTALGYAEQLEKAVQQSEHLPRLAVELEEVYSQKDMQAIVDPWKAKFDLQNGGLQRAPKFPVPGSWEFLLQYGVLEQDQDVINQVHHTLEKMACGGLYDHVGGGFARYSVDERWHVPHFEKMLYDNAQLVSLYLKAWQQKPSDFYAQVVRETLAWVENEMRAENGGFYCALDADSEGVEGKFYTFTQQEFETALDEDPDLNEDLKEQALDIFCITPHGNWVEERTNVLQLAGTPAELAANTGRSEYDVQRDITRIKKALQRYRSNRIRPGLDDKQICSWNALMLKAYANAYCILSDKNYLILALGTAAFFEKELLQPDGSLLHQPKEGGRPISGFLDDYAFSIDAFITLYEATFEEKWLHLAKHLSDYTLQNFWSEESELFWYTDHRAEQLFARKAQLFDDVMPSSNAALFCQLKKLGVIFEENNYQKMIDRVLPRMMPQMQAYGTAHWAWANLLLFEIHGLYEVVLSGPHIETWRTELEQHYFPNKIILGGKGPSELPILKGRTGLDAKIYLCKNRTCSLPVNHVSDLIKQRNTNNS